MDVVIHFIRFGVVEAEGGDGLSKAKPCLFYATCYFYSSEEIGDTAQETFGTLNPVDYDVCR